MDKMIKEINTEMNRRIEKGREVLLKTIPLWSYFMEHIMPEFGYEEWVSTASNVSDRMGDTIYSSIEGDEQVYVRVMDYKSIEKSNILDFIKTHQASHNLEKKNEWGILTDCDTFILTNADIIDLQQPEESLVFKIRITDRDYWKNMLNYFSYENLFKTQNTRYFVDVARFRLANILKSSNSYDTYKSTLLNFFDFYCRNHSYIEMCRDGRNPLEKVVFDDFKKFIQEKQKGKNKLLKEATLYNNYSHIAGYLQGLKIHNEDFRKERNLKLKDFDVERSDKDLTFFTKDNIEDIIEYFDNEKIHSNRNVLLFYLLVYIGMEKSTIINLRMGDIDVHNGKYIKDAKDIELPSSFIKRFKQLKKENQQNKTEYVFNTYNRGKYKKLSEGTINSLFIGLKDQDEKYENVSPLSLRNALAEYLFDVGFSIEEICYLMNIKIGNILSYISEEKIMKEGKRRLNGQIKKHPFYYSLDKE